MQMAVNTTVDVYDLLRRQIAKSNLRFFDRKDGVDLDVVEWTDNIHRMVRL